MNQEQLKAFLEKIRDSSSLQDRLMVAITPDEVVSIANEYGHEIIADKINQISEEELEGAAGGALSMVTGNRRTNGYGCLYTLSAEGC